MRSWCRGAESNRRHRVFQSWEVVSATVRPGPFRSDIGPDGRPRWPRPSALVRPGCCHGCCQARSSRRTGQTRPFLLGAQQLADPGWLLRRAVGSIRTGRVRLKWLSLTAKMSGSTLRVLRPPNHPVHGTLFMPEGREAVGAVVLIGGSGGSEPSYVAEPLAAEGLATLSLAYFDRPGLPNELREIPLEYFRDALWLLIAALPSRPVPVAVAWHVSWQRGCPAQRNPVQGSRQRACPDGPGQPCRRQLAAWGARLDVGRPIVALRRRFRTCLPEPRRDHPCRARARPDPHDLGRGRSGLALSLHGEGDL